MYIYVLHSAAWIDLVPKIDNLKFTKFPSFPPPNFSFIYTEKELWNWKFNYHLHSYTGTGIK